MLVIIISGQLRQQNRSGFSVLCNPDEQSSHLGESDDKTQKFEDYFTTQRYTEFVRIWNDN